MAKVNPGKREIERVVKILESEDHNSAEDMAREVLEVVFNEMVPKKFRHVVVGQLWQRNGGVTDEEGRDLRVAFGPFSTAGKARDAGRSLALGGPTGMEAKWWHLDLFPGTPAEFFKGIKKKHERENLLDGAHPREVRLALQSAWRERHPGEDLPPELQGMGWDDLEWASLWFDDYAYLLDDKESA